MRLPRFTRAAFAVVLASLVVAPAARAGDDPAAGRAAPDDGPHRHGFTLELGAGPAFTWVAPHQSGLGNPLAHDTSAGYMSLSGLSLSLGGYVTSDIAVVFRAAGTTFWADEFRHGTQQVVDGVYGVSVVKWFGDDIYLSAGPGLGLFVPAGGPAYGGQAGFALDVRGGVAFFTTTHDALTVGLEVVPGFYSSATTVGSGIDLEWHYF